MGRLAGAWMRTSIQVPDRGTQSPLEPITARFRRLPCLVFRRQSSSVGVALITAHLYSGGLLTQGEDGFVVFLENKTWIIVSRLLGNLDTFIYSTYIGMALVFVWGVLQDTCKHASKYTTFSHINAPSPDKSYECAQAYEWLEVGCLSCSRAEKGVSRASFWGRSSASLLWACILS